MTLTIVLLAFALFLFVLTTALLGSKRIGIRYALVWYFMDVCILLLTLTPTFFGTVTALFGFETMSNFIIAILIGVLILLTMILTIVCSRHSKKVILLTQELSLLQQQVSALKSSCKKTEMSDE